MVPWWFIAICALCDPLQQVIKRLIAGKNVAFADRIRLRIAREMAVIGTGHETIGTSHKTIGTGHETMGTGHKTMGTGHEIMGTGQETMGTGHETMRQVQAMFCWVWKMSCYTWCNYTQISIHKHTNSYQKYTKHETSNQGAQ